ncbi:S9 family peptidase [Corallococcus llansteffanensis]|uniref:Alpha/beta fold hydrolase n=1 Tax=Corallococcus llansteffanensis TaxID=2316731 RepID=A0A3A8QJP1_9BACT|nr:alpha/beta fold hydrolase [Corallococcus llansteffanensis]RKH68913.1 alpha/beta fold hydrolase [Corallococcus llansteffanensis]
MTRPPLRLQAGAEVASLGRRRFMGGALAGLAVLGGTLLVRRAGLHGAPGRGTAEGGVREVLSFLEEHGKLPVTASGDGRWLLEKRFLADAFELRVVDRATGAIAAGALSADTQLALAFCPKGRTVAFLACSGGDRRFALQFLDIDTGRVTAAPTPRTRSAAAPILWAPDGQRLLYTLAEGPSQHAVVFDRGSGQWQRMEPPLAERCEPAWSPDGRRIALASGQQPGALALVSLDDPPGVRTLVIADRGELRHLSWRPDGGALAVTLRRQADEYFSLLEVDCLTGRQSVVAQPPGDVSEPRYLGASELLFRVGSGGDARLMRARTDPGETLPVGPASGVVNLRSGAAEAGRVFALHVGRTSPPALLEVSSGEEPGVVGRATSAWTSGCTDVALRARDGLGLPGFLWRPGTQSALGPSAVVLVHGGPALQELPVWDARVQVLLRAGCHVLSFNYRGSTGYGARFERAGNDAERTLDVLAAVDYCVDRVGVPRERVVLLGSSYGTSLVAGAMVAEPGCCGAAVLVSTVRLSRIARRQLPAPPRVVAFHGENDNLLAPAQARREIEGCLGPAALAHEGAWSVFEHEGHHLHRLRSWARVYASVIALDGRAQQRDPDHG